MNKMVPL